MKNQLRKFYKQLRREEPLKDIKSRAVMEKLFSLPEYKKAKNVMFYSSTPDEVSTEGMISHALKDSKRALLPKTADRFSMSAVEIIENSSLMKNSMGILEPTKNKKVSPNDIDLIVMPALAFDILGNRLGHGGGCYDRFLVGADALKVGICFNSQLTEKLPTEAHDIKADYVITEKRLIKHGKNQAL